ncbi:MAG: hypothetical protein BGP09_02490 [Rhizobium sp. 60-20]|nr:MAG: hypothetical protein BGP09_02490 [Rhizobium sp. 60-20]
MRTSVHLQLAKPTRTGSVARRNGNLSPAYGRPDCIIIDGSQTNHQVVISSDTENRLRDRSRRSLNSIRIRRRQYLNNRIEQDHRRIKRRIRSMLGFKSTASAEITLRYRDGPHDAQATSEVRRQSTSVNRKREFLCAF